MAGSENIIRILKLPSGAFDKHRPVSDLLWTQVENLAAVVIRMIEAERREINTEEEASAFIKKYGALLHQRAAGKKPAHSQNGAGKKTARLSVKVAMKTLQKPPRSSRR
jgi:hypothetical protein